MARYFDGTDDKIESASAISNIDVDEFTIFIVLNFTTIGGLGVQHAPWTTASALSAGNSAAGINQSQFSGVDRLHFDYRFATTGGKWYIDDVTMATDTDYYIAIQYDRSDTANNPVIFINGAKKTVGSGLTEEITPSGAVKTGVQHIKFGENVGSSNDYDGIASEMAMWSGTVSDGALLSGTANGLSPLLIQRNNLLFYAPLMGNLAAEVDLIQGTSLTVTGATKATHPRVIMPSAQIIPFPTASASAALLPGSLALLGVGL